jgi:hypothetical protein
MEFRTYQVNTDRRCEDLEDNVRLNNDARQAVARLTKDFQSFVDLQGQRDAYTRRLELLLKDIEDRVWPWRKKMEKDRSPSPPADGISPLATYDPFDRSNSPPPAHGERPEWLPWPPRGPCTSTSRTSPPTSAGPSAAPSARPTPPTSRPSSARFRGRDGLGIGGQHASPNTTAIAERTSRPSSARSTGRQTALRTVRQNFAHTQAEQGWH